MLKLIKLSLIYSMILILSSQAQVIKIDKDLETYKRVSGVTGRLNSVGSDTLNNLMTLWAEGFQKMYPNVKIQIEGKGSSTAPPALIEEIARLSPMSRAMKSKEIDMFEKKFGYKPFAIKVAIDALAVFVHKNNPITGLNLTQVDSIFSSTYKKGGNPVTTWGQVGLKDSWNNRPITLYGRNSASGTYAFFKKVALGKGDYRINVKEQLGSSSVVQGIATELGAIGYSGIGYKTSGVRALPLTGSGAAYKAPTMGNCLNGEYPLARFLYVYVNKNPNAPLDKLTLEFLTYVLSAAGQQIVVKDGYYPLPAFSCAETLGQLK